MDDLPALPLPVPRTVDYASRPPEGQWRRRGRQFLRWWPALIGLSVLVVVIANREWIRGRWNLLWLQNACLTADLPADRPLFEQRCDDDPVRAEALARNWPGEYEYRSGADIAARPDPRWVAMAARLGVPPPTYGADATIFLHERWTPGGGRRLVAVEYQPRWRHCVYVVEPTAGWLTGQPRLLRADRERWGDEVNNAFGFAVGLHGPDRMWAGVADPTDRSRFTVAFLRGGVPGTFEYRLCDDDRLTMRLLDPDGFVTRALKQRAAEDAASLETGTPAPASAGE